jgi:hypothetical protein
MNIELDTFFFSKFPNQTCRHDQQTSGGIYQWLRRFVKVNRWETHSCPTWRRWVQSQKLDHQDTKRTKVVTPSPKVKG